MLAVSYSDFEKLAKRVAELETQLKIDRETEWDRHWLLATAIHIHDFAPGIDLTSLSDEEREDIFRQGYLLRLAAFRAAHDKASNTSE